MMDNSYKRGLFYKRLKIVAYPGHIKKLLGYKAVIFTIIFVHKSSAVYIDTTVKDQIFRMQPV